MNRKPNRLINQKSPYLLAHAYNPVDWYPWCDEAFETANLEDKPVFLSIGYSSCHWCHVMEKESFEDEEIAEILNRHFVPVKVDREERPDIDAVYMEVCMLFHGHGGWPLTVIMTPDKKPFFAGTYFPKESRPGRIGLKDLLLSVARYWKENRKDLLERSDRVVKYLRSENQREFEDIDKSVIDRCYHEFKSRFDEVYGGFSNKPKFPSPQNLMFLLRYHWLKGEAFALEMVEKTLKSMRLGGMFDHVGYGFHRYSTDRQWLLPHFEKMLYDQAMLMMAYSEAYQVTGDRFYGNVVEEIFDYLKRDMQAPEGGFYSSEDADSEGEEGRFYTFEYAELRDALGDEFELFARVFNVRPEGNYLEEATGELTGRNIIFLKEDIHTLAEKLRLEPDELYTRIKKWRHTLFSIRQRRVRPLRDDKILADWNGLVMAGLAKAGKATGNPEYTQAGLQVYRFIKDRMFKEGKLLHLYKDGEAEIEGMLDDYAFTVWGCLELYELTGDTGILEFAVNLQNTADRLLFDREGGGYFLSNHDRDLIVKPKPVFDGAYPSGNSVMVNNLLRLYHITSDVMFYERAVKTIRAFSSDIRRLPSYHGMFISGLMLLFYPVSEVVLAGDCQQAARVINSRFLPLKVLLYKHSNDGETLEKLAPYTGSIKTTGNCQILVCKNFSCNLPVSDINYALKTLEEKSWS